MLRSLLLTALFCGTSVAAAAAQQEEIRLEYDVLVAKRPVGSRVVTLRTVPGDTDFPETRLITAETRLDARVAGLDYTLHSRVDARITDAKTSFVASTRTNGETVEVQGRTDREGAWLITRVTAGEVETLRYRPIEVDLASIDLQDPTRRLLLDPNRGQADVLLVETGTTARGAVALAGTRTVRVGDDTLEPELIEWTAPTGPVRLAWNQDGVLVIHEMRVLGQTVVARLRNLPAPRSWGEVQVKTGFTDDVGSIGEEEL